MLVNGESMVSLRHKLSRDQGTGCVGKSLASIMISEEHLEDWDSWLVGRLLMFRHWMLILSILQTCRNFWRLSLPMLLRRCNAEKWELKPIYPVFAVTYFLRKPGGRQLILKGRYWSPGLHDEKCSLKSVQLALLVNRKDSFLLLAS